MFTPVVTALGIGLAALIGSSPGPTGSVVEPVRPEALVAAAGSFLADVDFETLELADLPGGRCHLSVTGALLFSGTLDGVAPGRTTAMVLAPCAEVLAAPGSHRDVFRFEGTFTGTVDGVEAQGTLTYTGVTQPGGDIEAQIQLAGDASALLRADAAVAVGGSYTGIATTPR